MRHRLVNPLIPMSDQTRISPYIINTVSSIQVTRIKKKAQLHVGNYKLIQYQMLQIDIISILWQTVRRTANEISGVKVLITWKRVLKVQISEYYVFTCEICVYSLYMHPQGRGKKRYEMHSRAGSTAEVIITVPL